VTRRMIALVLACAMASSPAFAQEKARALGAPQGGENDRAVEIPPDVPDLDPDADVEGNSNDRNAERDAEGEERAISGQGGVSSEPESGRFADLDQFVSNDDYYESPIGVSLQQNCARLAQGQVACGLAVVEIHPRSPAARAGLQPYSGLGHTLLGATVMGAAMVFPPAIAAIGLVDQSHVGETFDLIIAIDGQRIRNVSDFQRAVADVRFGDVIYLTLVRAGKRLQMPLTFAGR
jgi:PDZ domain